MARERGSNMQVGNKNREQTKGKRGANSVKSSKTTERWVPRVPQSGASYFTTDPFDKLDCGGLKRMFA